MSLRRRIQYIIPEARGEALRFHSPNLRSGKRNRHCAGEKLIPDSYWHGRERPDFAETASDVGGEQPPNVKKPITSTAPAVVLRSAGSSQLSQTNQTRAAVADDGLTSGSHGFMREDRYFLATFDGDGGGLWPGAADDATWTIAPVVRESDGLLITLSDGVTP